MQVEPVSVQGAWLASTIRTTMRKLRDITNVSIAQSESYPKRIVMDASPANQASSSTARQSHAKDAASDATLLWLCQVSASPAQQVIQRTASQKVQQYALRETEAFNQKDSL